MSSDGAIWYLPGDSGQPAGPYAAATIEEAMRSGQLAEATLCWRQGMSAWQPLAEVEPFAGVFAQKRAAAGRRVRRIAMGLVLLVCLAAGGTAAYFVVMGPAQVRQGRRDIAAGNYGDAVKTLSAYANQNPKDMRARYLLAIAQVNEYATADADSGFEVGSFRAATHLKEARANLGQALRDKSGWKEKAGTDLAAAAARIPSGADDALSRTAAISRLRVDLDLADKRELAKELMSRWSSSGGDASPALWHNDDVVQSILEWNPALSGQIVDHALGGTSGSEQDVQRILSTLERTAKRLPATAPEAASQLVAKAVSLYNSGRLAEAKDLLSTALKINPKAAETEETALLSIRLVDPDDAKLTRCQTFLKQWPKSPGTADVLMVMVKDAVAVLNRYGRYQQDQARPYLAAGCEAAKRLIRDFAATKDLDVEAYELSKRLADNRQFEEATDLMKSLLAVVPDPAIKSQIDNSIAQWRQQGGKGTLPPDLDELARQADTLENLKMTISVGGALQRLRDSSYSTICVVEVANDCTADKLNSEDRETLRRWVSNGGILWANNDVLSLFEIKYAWQWAIGGECRTIAPQTQPILTGCSNVWVSGEHAAYNLNRQGVRQLLNTTNAGFGASGQYCCWSLVPYGRGWISDVKKVDLSKGDGARFWVQFRLWCLGKLPGIAAYAPSGVRGDETAVAEPPVQSVVPAQTSSPTLSSPSRITDVNELQKALADGGAKKVLWVALSKNEIHDSSVTVRLTKWVRDGGVLWVETDLASQFGFVVAVSDGIARDYRPPRVGRGLLETGNPMVDTPSNSGRLRGPTSGPYAAPAVDYELDPNGLVFIGPNERAFIEKHIYPLVVDSAPQPSVPNRIRLVCGLCLPNTGGYVVLRPKVLNGPAGADDTFEASLLQFSLAPTRVGWPTIDPPASSRGRNVQPWTTPRRGRGTRGN